MGADLRSAEIADRRERENARYQRTPVAPPKPPGMPWPFVADQPASDADEVAAHAVMAIEALAGRIACRSGGGR